jgi:ATP-dependent RNA helicase RhlE
VQFSDLPFSERLHDAIRRAGFAEPTPVQARAIPPAMAGRDVIGVAQTGTGKTAAFALPLIHRLTGDSRLGGLVLAPTRELVQQIVDVFLALGRSSGLRTIGIVGGVRISRDHQALRSRPHIVVATPGRLNDHLQQRTISLKDVQVLVVDEADRMHDMGFIPQIRTIIAATPESRQTIMLTATLPADVEQIARRNMRDPVKVQVGPLSRPVERAEQTLFHLAETEKMALLTALLAEETGRVLVFARTKHRVDRLAQRLGDKRHPVTRLHGNRAQGQRVEAMAGFREGRYRVLVATDIAARGLDVADIEHVINYDFPRCPEDYVHRIGRTARLAASGRATSFVTPEDRGLVRDLERLVGSKMPLIAAPHSTLRAPSDTDDAPRAPSRSVRPGRTATPASVTSGHGGAGRTNSGNGRNRQRRRGGRRS